MKEPLKINYIEKDGIMFPDIQISNDSAADETPLGKYGQMAMNYLMYNHPNRYSLLFSEGELLPIMHKVNEDCYIRLDTIINQMHKHAVLLNSENTIESFENRIIIQLVAEEIILHEIVFVQR